MAERKCLKFITYNSTGLGADKCDYIKGICTKRDVDVLLLQETWLTHGNLTKLSSMHEDFLYHGKSGIADEELVRGRPYGGCRYFMETESGKVGDTGPCCIEENMCNQDEFT